MAQHNQTGSAGESAAVKHLADKGYTILERNWRYFETEIDIIAEKSGIIVVAEVKTRSSIDFGDPEAFVDLKKQKRMVKAANAYLGEKDLDREVRFDIIAVVKENGAHTVNHIEDAFYPTL